MSVKSLRTPSASLRASAAIAATLATALGGTPAPAPIQAPPPASGWEFRIEPYGWLTGIDGTVGIGDKMADVDASFSDMFTHKAFTYDVAESGLYLGLNFKF